MSTRDRRTWTVSITTPSGVNMDELMEAAMYALSERVWDACPVSDPWAIEVAENGLIDPNMSYAFEPDPKSAYGFAAVWVHASDGTECNDPQITAGADGVATCYAHEEVCRPLNDVEER